MPLVLSFKDFNYGAYFRNKLECFSLASLFQPCLMLAGQARAYLSEAPLSYSVLGRAPDLAHKHQIMLEKLARDEHSALTRKISKLITKSFQTFCSDWKVTATAAPEGDRRKKINFLVKGSTKSQQSSKITETL